LTDLIIDANVVAKWVINETGDERAWKLIAPDIFLRAPDLLVSELANVLWKKTRRGDLTTEQARERLDTILQDHIDVTVHLLPARILAKRASEIAIATGRSIYDSLYLAAAVQARCRLITADERFVRSIKDPFLQHHIVALDKFMTKSHLPDDGISHS
jgi:predicted nucleic acid-binding protein